MMKFDLAGFYKYYQLPLGRGDLTGSIAVDERNGFFEGPIHDDGSRAPEQTIQGYLTRKGELRKMIFLKFPPRDNLANLGYELTRVEGDIGSPAGKYVGTWKALPLKIEFNRDLALFIASIHTDVTGIGDEAEINLQVSTVVRKVN